MFTSSIFFHIYPHVKEPVMLEMIGIYGGVRSYVKFSLQGRLKKQQQQQQIVWIHFVLY